MRNLFHCDLCGTLVHEHVGDLRAHPMILHTYQASQNPMAKVGGKGAQGNHFELPEVCQDCHRAINAALASAIAARKAAQS